MISIINQTHIDKNKSRVFNFLKVFAIFMVMTGHFFKEYGLLWVPVTVGLLIFSFSSGYFTSIKYKGNFSKKKYWKKKINRLGIHLIVINVTLLILFIVQGRENIISWHSLINVVGLNGFLNWFGIPNHSPYGAGMWYFTLLLIFYVCYPFLQTMNKTCISIFTFCFIIGMFFLNQTVYMGHALWLTVCGFIAGVWAEKRQFVLSANLGRILAALIFMVMMWLNFMLGVKSYNFFFILFFSIALIYGCMDINITDKMNDIILFFSSCLLEIYLLHGYLKLEIVQIKVINFFLTVIIVVIFSKIVNWIALILNRKLQEI